MSYHKAITIPLLNPNEPESILVAIHIQNGKKVSPGDLLCTLETTKSTAELTAEYSGFISGLNVGIGDSVRSGDLFCYISDTPDWQPELTGESNTDEFTDIKIPEGLRITQPALALIKESKVDVGAFAPGTLITENMVRTLISDKKAPIPLPTNPEYDPTAIIVYGGGGHGKTLIDFIHTLRVYKIIGIIDDGIIEGTEIMGYPVLGGEDILAELKNKGIRLAANAVGGIGNLQIRIKVFKSLLNSGFVCPTLLHPKAFCESSAQLAQGTHVFPMAYIGSDVIIGFGAIINTSAVVSHDCILGDYVNISPGAILAGGVQVGEGTLVGMGVTVNLNVKIGAGSRIGNGATVKSDIPAYGLVRAGAIWPD